MAWFHDSFLFQFIRFGYCASPTLYIWRVQPSATSSWCLHSYFYLFGCFSDFSRAASYYHLVLVLLWWEASHHLLAAPCLQQSIQWALQIQWLLQVQLGLLLLWLALTLWAYLHLKHMEILLSHPWIQHLHAWEAMVLDMYNFWCEYFLTYALYFCCTLFGSCIWR
jgi:hypothetical protein